MIYHDLSFTAVPDPRHPGRFKIVAYPPLGEVIVGHNRTGVLTTMLEADARNRQAGVGEPTPARTLGRIARMTAELKARHLEDLAASNPKKSRVPDRTREPGGRTARVSAEARGAAGGLVRAEVGDLTGRGGAGEGGW